jgi:hypothetical protein
MNIIFILRQHNNNNFFFFSYFCICTTDLSFFCIFYRISAEFIDVYVTSGLLGTRRLLVLSFGATRDGMLALRPVKIIVNAFQTFNCNHHLRDFAFLNGSCSVEKPYTKGAFDYGISLGALQSGILESTDFPRKLAYCFCWGLRNLRFGHVTLFVIQR